MGAWDYRRYGSITGPIHKSHLNTITGDYGCLRKFRYQQDERCAPRPANDNGERTSVSAKAALGTAAHETIARALMSPRMQLLGEDPPAIPREHVALAFAQELHREAGQRRIEWGSDSPDTLIAERVDMIRGALLHLHEHVHSIELVEAGFIVRLGEYWLSGHVDLIYRPKNNPEGLGLADWKTSSQRPDVIELDHSWECGVYAAAMLEGFFVKREVMQLMQVPEGWQASAGTPGTRVTAVHPSRYIAERDCLESVLIELAAGVPLDIEQIHFKQYPTEIHYVHLGDYVPYRKKGKKRIERPEDLKHWGLTHPGDVGFSPGQLRGPAWLPVKQTQEDIPRLSYRLKNIVGTIRMGRFIDMVSERCKRCAYSSPCLNSGYGTVGDERKQLEDVMKQLDLTTEETL